VKNLTLILMAFFLTLGFISTASALPTITYGGQSAPDSSGFTTSQIEAIVWTFNLSVPMPSVFTSINGDYHYVTGSWASNYAAPANDSTQYLSIPNTSDNNPSAYGSVTVKLSNKFNYFGIYWGSIDLYNNIDFFDGTTLVGTVTGSEVGNPANGSWTGDNANKYVNITGIIFDSFVLNTTGIAFEVDNIAVAPAPTPEPATLLLMGFGSGIMGTGIRRLRKKFRK
jgi:hypothetical protein